MSAAIDLNKQYELYDLKNIYVPYDIPEFFYNRKVFNPMFFEFYNHENAGIMILQFRKRFHVNLINYCYIGSLHDPDKYAGKYFINMIIAASTVLWNYKQNKLNESIDAAIAEVKGYTTADFYETIGPETFEMEWAQEFINVDDIVTILSNCKIPHEPLVDGFSDKIKNSICLLRDAIQFSILFSNIQSYQDNIEKFVKYMYAMHGIKTASELMEIVKTAYLGNNPVIKPQTEYTQKLLEEFKAHRLDTFRSIVDHFMHEKHTKNINVSKIEQCSVLPYYIF